MRVFLFLAISFFLFVNLAVAEEIFSVRLLEKSTVVGPKVDLGDVGNVIGKNNAVLGKVRRIHLGSAAPAGKKIKIGRGYIKIALRREGYSDKDYSFTGSDSTEVLTESQQFSTSELLASLRSFIRRAVEAPPEDVEVQLSGLEKKITLPAGDVRAEFRPPLSGKYEGTLLITAELSVGGRFVKAVPIRVKVEITHSAVVTTKMIERGDKFTKENVVLARKSTTSIMRGSISRLEDVLGRSAAVPVPAGVVLRLTEIFDPPLIKQGQIIQAVVRKGNLEISVEAKAMENGKIGDRIRVENTLSRKVLRGKVLNEKTVLVDREVL